MQAYPPTIRPSPTSEDVIDSWNHGGSGRDFRRFDPLYRRYTPDDDFDMYPPKGLTITASTHDIIGPSRPGVAMVTLVVGDDNYTFPLHERNREEFIYAKRYMEGDLIIVHDRRTISAESQTIVINIETREMMVIPWNRTHHHYSGSIPHELIVAEFEKLKGEAVLRAWRGFAFLEESVKTLYVDHDDSLVSAINFTREQGWRIGAGQDIVRVSRYRFYNEHDVQEAPGGLVYEPQLWLRPDEHGHAATIYTWFDPVARIIIDLDVSTSPTARLLLDRATPRIDEYLTLHRF